MTLYSQFTLYELSKHNVVILHQHTVISTCCITFCHMPGSLSSLSLWTYTYLSLLTLSAFSEFSAFPFFSTLVLFFFWLRFQNGLRGTKRWCENSADHRLVRENHIISVWHSQNILHSSNPCLTFEHNFCDFFFFMSENGNPKRQCHGRLRRSRKMMSWTLCTASLWQVL